MRLHIDGEPARLFFRYKKTFMDKHRHIRQDVHDKAKTLATAPIGSISHTEVEQAVMQELPPNITEFYIVKGWAVPDYGMEDEAPKIVFGRSWRHPKDAHNKELARNEAVAHGVASWPREARRLLWAFIQQRGQRMVEEGGKPVLRPSNGKPIWIPWDDLNIITHPAAYALPESPNKGVALRDRPMGALDPD